MSNGDALKKRYEVRDAETGEVIEDAYVLRPTEDQLAETVMYGYARLCGLEDPYVLFVGLHPEEQGSELWEEAVESCLSPSQDSASFDGESIVEFSNIGMGGDGTAERAVALMRSMGYEPVSVVCRRIDEDEANKASARVNVLARAQVRRERTAGQAITRIEGPGMVHEIVPIWLGLVREGEFEHEYERLDS